jgi:hypothetical protein
VSRQRVSAPIRRNNSSPNNGNSSLQEDSLSFLASVHKCTHSLFDLLLFGLVSLFGWLLVVFAIVLLVFFVVLRICCFPDAYSC